MFQMTLSVDWPSIKKLMGLDIMKDFNDARLNLMLREHKFVIGDKIIEEYENELSKDDDRNSVESDLLGLMDNYQVDYIDEAKYIKKYNNPDAGIILRDYFKEIKNIYAKADITKDGVRRFKERDCKYVCTLDQIKTDESCVIAKFSYPANFTIDIGESEEFYHNWIKCLIGNAEHVNIIDPYLFKNESVSNMIADEIIPSMRGNDKRITLHSTTREFKVDNAEYIKNAAVNNGVCLKSYFYDSDIMHGRFITTDDIYLNIDVGLDLIKDRKVRKSCRVSYDDIKSKKGSLTGYLEYEKKNLCGGEPMKMSESSHYRNILDYDPNNSVQHAKSEKLTKSK